MDVLIVAPPGLRISIRSGGDSPRVHLFESMEHLDRWRSGNDEARASLGACVDRAAEEISVSAELSPQMSSVFGWLRAQPAVPCVKQLAEAVTSRRSFFRIWSQEMKERPSAFLGRLGVHFARQLLDAGEPLDSAARRTGFASIEAMNEALRRNGTTFDPLAPRGR